MQLFIKYQLLVFFLTVISMSFFNSIFHFWQFERNNENRIFKSSININPDNLNLLPKECEEYVNDNFTFRSPLLDIYHHIKFYYYKISPHPDKTLIGNDGWFFLAQKELKIYEGKLNFTESHLTRFKNEWDARKKYLDSLGIPFYWTICPMKQNIYEEYLPFNVSKNKQIKRIELLKDYFKEKQPNLIIDPTPNLIEAKKRLKLFYKLDGHWNYNAGYIVSNLILDKIKDKFPKSEIGVLPSYEWKDTILHEGYHYKVIGIEKLYETDVFPINNSESSIRAKGYGIPKLKDYGYKVFETRFVNQTVKSGPKVLIIGDSFTNTLKPFIKEPLKEVTFINDCWNYDLDKSVITKINPDIIIFVSLETHLEGIIR